MPPLAFRSSSREAATKLSKSRRKGAVLSADAPVPQFISRKGDDRS